MAIPKILPIFPLLGTVVPPGAALPFNIFEPRYLRMIEAVMKNGRYLLMGQPKEHIKDDEVQKKTKDLYDIASLAKIVFFDEDSPSRYRITIIGLQRVKLLEEQAMKGGYRRFTFDRKPFAGDLLADDFSIPDRKLLLNRLSLYLHRFDKMIDWEDFQKLDDDRIILIMMIAFPFTPAEKQALFEARTMKECYELLLTLIDMAIKEEGSTPNHKSEDLWDKASKIILQ